MEMNSRPYKAFFTCDANGLPTCMQFDDIEEPKNRKKFRAFLELLN